jgi:4-hydroxy-tetrahydrodipicolinate reductase
MAIKLVVAGAAGRMGSRIVDLAKFDKNLKVIYQLESKLPVLLSGLGLEKPAESKFVTDRDKIKEADVVIDFTNPKATLEIASKAAEHKKPIVIGTTGFSPLQEKQLKRMLRSVPVLKAANMSLAVNVLFKIAKEAAKALSDYEVKIEEKHHIKKIDSPSGTALHLAKLMEAYLEKKIAIVPKREGDVIGEHKVTFSDEWEDLELFHRAKSRDTFALGALFGAKWLVGQKPGFYTMQDALSLK